MPVTLSPFEIEALLLSLKAALWGTGLALPFAAALAVVMARKNFPGKFFVDGLIHLPLVVPPVAVGYLLLLLLGRRGLLGESLDQWFGLSFAFNWKGAALAAAVMGFPLMVRAIRLAVEAIDPMLEKAARTLGATPVHMRLKVTLPLAGRGLLAGAILGFARALGEFGATITFVANIPGETRTLPLALYSALQMPGGEWAGLRLVILSLLLAGAALAAVDLLDRLFRARAASAPG